jgi:hypothetical protein
MIQRLSLLASKFQPQHKRPRKRPGSREQPSLEISPGTGIRKIAQYFMLNPEELRRKRSGFRDQRGLVMELENLLISSSKDLTFTGCGLFFSARRPINVKWEHKDHSFLGHIESNPPRDSPDCSGLG